MAWIVVVPPISPATRASGIRCATRRTRTAFGHNRSNQRGRVPSSRRSSAGNNLYVAEPGTAARPGTAPAWLKEATAWQVIRAPAMASRLRVDVLPYPSDDDVTEAVAGDVVGEALGSAVGRNRGDDRLAEVLIVDDGVEMTGFDPVSAL
jgi:hypothetical protein